jgi:serine/threonine-protein kinase HipA
MAGRPSSSRSLAVWMNGELVGHWSLGAYSSTFAYDKGWLTSQSVRPLSLSLALSEEPIRGPAVDNYFDNLLPERKQTRQRLAAAFRVKSLRTFDLLEQVGRDCVGAVQLLPKGNPAPNVRRVQASPMNEADIEHLLDQTASERALTQHEPDEDLRLSIAGVQDKTALLWHEGTWQRPQGATPTTHLLKLPLGEVGAHRIDFSHSVQNEWLCAQVAHAFGLPVASCEIARFGRHTVLVVERFDRRWMSEGWWARLPQEDFCQVNGLAPEQKYEERGGPGMARILDTLRGSQKPAVDRRNFLASQLLFWLLAAPDGHAKNFSISLQAGGRFELTPLYDIMSAWPAVGVGPRKFDYKKLKLAMAVRSKNAHYRMDGILRRHWNAVARATAMGPDFEEVIQAFIKEAPRVLSEVQAKLPKGFPAEVADPVLQCLLAQARLLEGMPSGLLAAQVVF